MYSNTYELGWILLANQTTWLLVLVGEPTKAHDNQYGKYFEVTWIKTNALLKQKMQF